MGLLGTAAFAAPQTDVYIGITSAGAKKQPVIAMPAFVAKKDIVSAAQEVHDTLRADILYGRYFEVSEDGPAFEVKDVKDTLSGWSKQRAAYLIGGEMTYEEPHYTIKLYVYDVATQAPVFAKAFKGNRSSLRRLAHIAAGPDYPNINRPARYCPIQNCFLQQFHRSQRNLCGGL